VLAVDSFTKAVLSYLETVSDPKPGRVSRGILPIVQSANYMQTSVSLNFDVSKMFHKTFFLVFASFMLFDSLNFISLVSCDSL
jgi:hypothetical protein